MTDWRVAGLDGLRAIAVTAVIAFHVDNLALPSGFLGVEVFFVISGFIITLLWRREQLMTGQPSLTQFWRRRARRLLPALAIVLVTVTILARLIDIDLLVGIGAQLLGAVTFTSNWVELSTTGDYFGASTTSLFGNLWSLGIEEQFYLFWPLLLLVALRRSRRLALSIAVAGAVASAALQLAMSADPALSDAAYYATPARVFGLMMGSAIALLPTSMATPRPSGLRTCTGFAALAAILMLFSVNASTSAPQRGVHLVLIASLTTIMLWAIRGSERLAGRLLDTPALRWIGVRSYGLYLWHVPLIALADAAVPPIPGWGQLVGRLLAVVLTVCAAAASHRWIELPIRRHGLRGAWSAALSERPRLRAAAAVTITAALIATLVITATAPRMSSLEERLSGAVPSVNESSHTGGDRAWQYSF